MKRSAFWITLTGIVLTGVTIFLVGFCSTAHAQDIRFSPGTIFVHDAAGRVTGVIISPGPLPSPAEAVAVLQRDHLASDVTGFFLGEPTPGRSGSTAATGPTAGPWALPPEREPRRLEGTPLSQPPAVYGSPFGIRGNRGPAPRINDGK